MDNTISLVRGDTHRRIVKVKINGEVYQPVDGDVVEFSMKKRAKDEPLLVKVIPNDTMELHIAPEDTESLDYGKYKYDIRITLANGDRFHFIEASDFVVKEDY